MNLALFDFDGTITTREMFSDFMHFAVTPRRLASGRLLLAPVVMGYKLGLVSSNVIRSRAARFGFRGVPLARLDHAGERFAREVLPGVLRTQAMERIAWHKAQGDQVVVVSGGLDVYLRHWCRQQELGLICSELDVVDGHLSGRYRGLQCVGAEKPRRVLERYNPADFGCVYAYGDTSEDLDLLGIADRKYFNWQELA
ncbi:HAD-IB family hydrolase [Rhodanobacter sp. AS-Z3]|uniref:HAD family hydrolase n=1 Tax=Rhodanobacter sp. AS-Z3 TaxID=3031330 RepID=UPI00247916DA|nr:HAD family hydrolase [Rhodanobacter sp. AS-Z3]WEN15625.1 HAD-IB family hydrolase [Rhodanobacter sp. AS-Z3]